MTPLARDDSDSNPAEKLCEGRWIYGPKCYTKSACTAQTPPRVALRLLSFSAALQSATRKIDGISYSNLTCVGVRIGVSKRNKILSHAHETSFRDHMVQTNLVRRCLRGQNVQPFHHFSTCISVGECMLDSHARAMNLATESI